MNPLFEAAREFQFFFEALKWPFCFIGYIIEKLGPLAEAKEDPEIMFNVRRLFDEMQ